MVVTYDKNSNESVFVLSYASVSAAVFSLDDFEEIAVASKRNNRQMDVTGMLLHCGDEFVQVLEGAQQQVMALYERIARDPRHTQLTIIGTDRAEARRFPDWSMGCFVFPEQDAPSGFVFHDENGRRRLRHDAFGRFNDLFDSFYEDRRDEGARDSVARMIIA